MPDPAMPDPAIPDQETLLEFPCRFPVKVMGLAADDFPDLVLALVRVHAPDVRHGDMTTRGSTGGKYLSVTVTFDAVSKAQIDAIYMDLSAHARVLMSL